MRAKLVTTDKLLCGIAENIFARNKKNLVPDMTLHGTKTKTGNRPGKQREKQGRARTQVRDALCENAERGLKSLYPPFFLNQAGRNKSSEETKKKTRQSSNQSRADRKIWRREGGREKRHEGVRSVTTVVLAAAQQALE
jgi:hypothetical protein